MNVTYPPELLPIPDDDDEVEIVICDPLAAASAEWLSRLPVTDAPRFRLRLLRPPAQETRGGNSEIRLGDAPDT
jgi:hypothetical protein